MSKGKKLNHRFRLIVIMVIPVVFLLAIPNFNVSLAHKMQSKVVALQTIALAAKSPVYLTMEKRPPQPEQGFSILYPSDWNITDNNFVTYFRSPQNEAVVSLSATSLSSNDNITLDQYSSNEINAIKSMESSKIGNCFKMLESTPYLLSGNPGHKISFLNATTTKIDGHQNCYRTIMVWTVANGKIYRILCSAVESKYFIYAPTFVYMMNSFELL
jgi:PsbP